MPDPQVPVDSENLPFALDRFQLEAIAALDADRSVLVAAPTGAGKTVVADHAVAKALRQGTKAFYTTPIKALSNQKYRDLVARYGPARVGLLTGDTARNGSAPVVVMTTEVLRNMIYAASPALSGLRYVVLDEIHFLQDTYRGPVWEEVIIHLPPEVRLVCLSATVSNAAELAEWITTVRGPVDTVVELRRPVALENRYLVGDRNDRALHLLPILVDGRPNPDGSRLDDPGSQRHGRPGRPRRRYYTPRRLEVIDGFVDDAMLPAIVFIFSRAACDDARDEVFDSGVRLTSVHERARIREIVDRCTAALSDRDLDALGFGRFLGALEAGIAAHHAGMVPAFKEAVEACFTEGLTKVVFATETLALGVNMPARSVVIERLTKFGGERREALTPAEYTQLTGRAGRRGIDPIGYAVVLWSPFVSFDQVAALAASRSFSLRSAFRPTYNMAANLVARHSPEQARHLLDLSFAQFQVDRAVVEGEARLERVRDRLERLRREATCEHGDVGEYRRLLADRPRTPTPAGLGASARIDASMAELSPGDVVVLDGRPMAVLSLSIRRGHPRLSAIDAAGAVGTFTAADLDEPLWARLRLPLPVPYAPRDRSFRQRVSASLREAGLRPGPKRGSGGPARSARVPVGSLDIPATAADHPVARCPRRSEHLRAAVQAERVQRELDDLDDRTRLRTGGLSSQFDRVLAILRARGHVAGWELTGRGQLLARTYHEADLLVAEALADGLLDDLRPAELAGVASCFGYEHRGRDAPPPPVFPSPLVRHRFEELAQRSDRLAEQEEEAGLPRTRAPDPGLIGALHAWAQGAELEPILRGAALSGGDFVRNVRQCVDLLGQLTAAAAPATSRTARAAMAALDRGVVAATADLDPDDDPTR